jgi:hypothetical protein
MADDSLRILFAITIQFWSKLLRWHDASAVCDQGLLALLPVRDD